MYVATYIVYLYTFSIYIYIIETPFKLVLFEIFKRIIYVYNSVNKKLIDIVFNWNCKNNWENFDLNSFNTYECQVRKSGKNQLLEKFHFDIFGTYLGTSLYNKRIFNLISRYIVIPHDSIDNNDDNRRRVIK